MRVMEEMMHLKLVGSQQKLSESYKFMVLPDSYITSPLHRKPPSLPTEVKPVARAFLIQIPRIISAREQLPPVERKRNHHAETFSNSMSLSVCLS